MIAQRCPKCRSPRVRRGYTDTPLLLRMIGVYSLLCDNCNLLFKGFAVPGTVPAHRSRHRRRDARAGRIK
jgi:ribosomal protein L37AE/L43A